MNRILIILLFSVLPVFGVEPDLFLTFESIAAGTTDGSIDLAQVIKTNGTVLSGRSFVGSAGKVSVENGGLGNALLRPVIVNGTSYDYSAPTKHLLCKSDNTVSTFQCIEMDLLAHTKKFSYGMSITISNFTGLGSFYNAFGVATSTDMQFLSIVNNSPPFFQNEGNTSPYGEDINVANNITFWVTGLYDSKQTSTNDRSRMYIYNQTNMALVGFSIDRNVVSNSSVDTVYYGIPDTHTKDAGTVFRLGSLTIYTNGTVFPVWPGNNVQMPTNTSTTAIANAISIATAGDTLLLPATNLNVSSAISISKQLIVAGMKATNVPTRLINDSGSDTTATFTMDANLIVISNIWFEGTASAGDITGIGTFMSANATPRYGIVSHCLFTNLQVGTWWENYGASIRNTYINNQYSGRHFGYIAGGATVRSQQYPLAFNGTNYVIYEDGAVEINSNIGTSDANIIGMCSSQEAASYIVRFFQINIKAKNIAPLFDYHGNDPGIPSLRGVCGGQLYKINVTVSGSGTFDGKFADYRGGQHLCYSNTVTGYDVLDNITLREEDSDMPPTDIVENTYVFQNFEGASGTTFMPAVVAAGSESKIVLNTQYFTNAPAGDYCQWSPPYPYGSTPPNCSPAPGLIGPLKIRNIRLRAQ